MTQTVRVLKNFPDGTAQVIHIRQSACSGDCHKCSGCGAAQETLMLTAKNPIGAQAGDLVILESYSGPVLAAAAALYILPLVLFFLGYPVGALLWERGALTACLAFAAGVALSVFYDRKLAKKRSAIYTITGFAHKDLHGF